MSAETLRRAAEWTRMVSNKCCECTDGHHDWTHVYGTEGDVRMSRDAARAVADWLDAAADLSDELALTPGVEALTVARALLGETTD